EELLVDRDRLESDLTDALSQIEKIQATLRELKSQECDAASTAAIAELSAELDLREKTLNELSARIARQKVELETELAEIEAQRYELEEAKNAAASLVSGEADPEALQALKDAFEEERAQLAESRLDLH